MESIDKIDDLFDTEVKVKTIKKGKLVPSKKGIIIGLAVVGVLAAANIGIMVYNANSPDGSLKIESSLVLESVKSTVSNSANSVKNAGDYKNKVFRESTLITKENSDRLAQIAEFDLPAGLKDNQISRSVAQTQFKNKEYFLSLASEGEGFRSKIYNDNIGFAFGNGWNVSMQNAQYNENLAKSISNDPYFINKIVSLSGKIGETPVSGDFSNVRITPQKSMQIVELMGNKFKEGAINGIAKFVKTNHKARDIITNTGQTDKEVATKIFNSLQPNEQAALVYHAYKVGAAGFAQYRGLITELINYSLNTEKSTADKNKVSEHFTYKYKMNGEVKEDIRASAIVASMFANLQAYGYIIGKNPAPMDIYSSVPAFKKYNIATPKNVDELKIPDPVGEMRQELESKGGKISIQIMPSTELIKKENTVKAQKRAVPTQWL